MSNPSALPGEPIVPAEALFSVEAQDWPPKPFNVLTSRQLEMIDLASRGFTREESANALSIKLRVVNNERIMSLGILKAININHIVRLGCDAGLFLKPIEKPTSLRKPTDNSLAALDAFSYGKDRNGAAQELDITPGTVKVEKFKPFIFLELRLLLTQYALLGKKASCQKQPSSNFHGHKEPSISTVRKRPIGLFFVIIHLMSKATMFIEYFVDDMDYYKRFFCEVLGFSIDRDDGSFVQLLRGHDKVLLDGEAKNQPPDYHFYNKISNDTNGIGIESCYVVDDLDGTYAKAKAFSGLKLTPIELKEWGVRDFRIVVPDNYYLRITELIS